MVSGGSTDRRERTGPEESRTWTRRTRGARRDANVPGRGGSPIARQERANGIELTSDRAAGSFRRSRRSFTAGRRRVHRRDHLRPRVDATDREAVRSPTDAGLRTRTRRVRDHRTPVLRMIAISARILRRSNPGLRLVVSFADGSSWSGHHGGIYQAGGWIYLGANLTRTCTIYGKPVNWRTIAGKYGRAWRRLAPERNPGWVVRFCSKPSTCVMPLDDEMRETLTPSRSRTRNVGTRPAMPVRSDTRRASGRCDPVPPGRGRFDPDPVGSMLYEVWIPGRPVPRDRSRRSSRRTKAAGTCRSRGPRCSDRRVPEALATCVARVARRTCRRTGRRSTGT